MTIIDMLWVYEQIDVNGDQYAGEAMAVTTGIRLAYNVSTTGSLSLPCDFVILIDLCGATVAYFVLCMAKNDVF